MFPDTRHPISQGDYTFWGRCLKTYAHFLEKGKVGTEACLFLVILWTMLLPCPLLAAPSGILAHHFSVISEDIRDTPFQLTVETDIQHTTFSRQYRRGPDIDANGFERQFAEIRSSSLDMNYGGIRAGLALDGLPMVYLSAGCATADLPFYYQDTLTPGKDSYEREISFEVDPFFIPGGGIAATLMKKKVFGEKQLIVGLDLGYRFMDISTSKTVSMANEDLNKVSYEAKMHECQLSLFGSLDSFLWQFPFTRIDIGVIPYAGWKISVYFADEVYRDPENETTTGESDPVLWDDSIDISNQMSFITGLGISLNDRMMMGIETRFGDEDGYTLLFTYGF